MKMFLPYKVKHLDRFSLKLSFLPTGFHTFLQALFSLFLVLFDIFII